MKAKKELVVVLVCLKDFANVAYTYQEALRSVGVNATAYASRLLNFLEYPQTCAILGGKSGNYIRKADVIIYMHSQYLDLGLSRKALAAKKLMVFHGGTNYRKFSDSLNRNFERLGAKTTLIQTLDLWNLGAKNKVWMLPAVNTNLLKPTFQPMRRRKVIAHYPHKAPYKGTGTINKVLDRMVDEPSLNTLFEYRYDGERTVWTKNIERMDKCDIYIESLSLSEKTNRHEWSVTALEAAALGKIVVTNMTDVKRYEKEYGPCALHIANTEEQLFQTLSRLVTMESNIEFQKLKSESRAWVEKLHSYRAIGARLKKVIEG